MRGSMTMLGSVAKQRSMAMRGSVAKHRSSGRYFTYTKSNKMWKVGCFYGTGQELIEKAYADSELSGKCYEAYVKLIKELEKIQEEYK